MYGDISLWFPFSFSWWLVMLSIFPCACWPFICLHWKNVFSIFQPIFQLACLIFLMLSCISSPEENKNLKRYMHSNVHYSIIYNSQDMETNWVSINNEWIKKNLISWKYIMEYFSSIKHNILSFKTNGWI